MRLLCIVFCLFWLIAKNNYGDESIETEDIEVDDDDNIFPDPSLQQWLEQHYVSLNQKKLADLNTKAKLLSLEEKATQLFFLANKEKKLKEELKKEVIHELSKAIEANHSMKFYFIETLYNLGVQKLESDKNISDILSGEPNALSCPSFDYIHKRLTDQKFISTNSKATKILLNKLKGLNNKDTAAETLEIFARILPKAHQQTYKKDLVDFIQKFPKTALKVGWLRNYVVVETTLDPTNNIFYNVDLSLERRHCQNARQNLINLMRQKNSSLDLEGSLKQIGRVAQCFKKKRYSKQITVWESFKKDLEKKFENRGSAWLKYEIARVYWNQDENEKAKHILDEVREIANTLEDEKLQGKIAFLQARIFDNEDNYQEAAIYYSEVVQKYPQHEIAQEAEKLLILMNIGMQNWQKTYELTAQLAKKDIAPQENPQASSLGFAMFWAARSALELGKEKEGVEFLQKLATEYFSTYYGALGHYMLEYTTGKKLEFLTEQPSSFSPKIIYNAFPAKEKNRLKNIEILLRLGMEDRAVCEINELVTTNDNYEQLFAKALYLHASEQWLDSIKVYSAIPREFRRILPVGVERLLFPKKFDSEIEFYANKAKIDPYFVFSLIRQESVFNPQATSHAGAKGLMQLMGETARIEARNLPTSYVDLKFKNRIIGLSRQKSGLFDVKANVAVGIHYLKKLMKRYDNTALSLAAYNAGPTVTARWIKKFHTEDMLFFVERVPYKETRDYVKLIVRNYFYYKKWYDQDTATMPELNSILKTLAFLPNFKNGKAI